MILKFIMNISFFLWLFFILSMISVFFTIYSIVKAGDERKQYLLMKSSYYTVIALVFILVILAVFKLTLSSGFDSNMELHPLIMLGCLSIIFSISLLISKRKYGG